MTLRFLKWERWSSPAMRGSLRSSSSDEHVGSDSFYTLAYIPGIGPTAVQVQNIACDYHSAFDLEYTCRGLHLRTSSKERSGCSLLDLPIGTFRTNWYIGFRNLASFLVYIYQQDANIQPKPPTTP